MKKKNVPSDYFTVQYTVPIVSNFTVLPTGTKRHFPVKLLSGTCDKNSSKYSDNFTVHYPVLVCQ